MKQPVFASYNWKSSHFLKEDLSSEVVNQGVSGLLKKWADIGIDNKTVKQILNEWIFYSIVNKRKQFT